jgi:plasmid stabilization system protein ParE
MSRKDIEYRPHVWPSVLQAAEWYEGEKAGLGGDFVDELETCFLRISEHPEQFPLALRRPAVHRAMVNRFPYAVYFVAEPSRVVVISVVHLKRAAGQWKRHTRRPRSN